MGLRRFLKKKKQDLKLYASVNWYKTLYFNYKKFPFGIARKLPVIFYGPIKFTNLSGEIILEGPVHRGMIGFGVQFEQMTVSRGTAELNLQGTLVFRHRAHIGKDCFIFIKKGASCIFGDMGCLGSSVKIICTKSIQIGNWAGIGYESQVVDTTAHPMLDTKSGEYTPMEGPIVIGNYNTISNRVSIMNNTITPDSCVVASNSVCNRDYTTYGNDILIGGIPAKLLREHYVRDWESEKAMLLANKIKWK